MKKSVLFIALFAVALLNVTFAQSVAIGPRLTGNMNIYNQKGLTGTWNGVGIGIGGQLDVSFSERIGLIVNLTAFDMKSFSNSQTSNNVTSETSLSLSYITIDPLFKVEFSGFYMVAGPSFGVKINSSGENTQTASGQSPQVNAMSLDTKSIRFDIATGVGYNFKIAQDMVLGSDFMAYIPLTDTYNFPGISNSVLTLKLGASLKFNL
ncbi:MAG: PorT family protein [Ignavibacteria bacterium]|nr:PorT family protein [Ignavibacteria bacterium]